MFKTAKQYKDNCELTHNTGSMAHTCATQVLLLDKACRLRQAAANLYRRGAVAAFENNTKDFERLGVGAANCMDKAAKAYQQAKEADTRA